MNDNVSDKRIFYGWYIVGVAFLGHFIGSGTLFYVFNAFLNPLCEARGWSRTEFNAAPAIAMIMFNIGTLVCGFLLQRVSVRAMITAGALICAISFVSLGLAHSLWLFYLLFIFLAAGTTAVSGIVANVAVSNWFVQKRGKALGIANTGISFSGVVLPYAAMLILARTNIQTAFGSIGLMVLCLAPIAWLVVKNTPEDCGLNPDGIAIQVGAAQKTSAAHTQDASAQAIEGEQAWTLLQLIRSTVFWKVGTAYGLMLLCIGPIMFQLAPRFMDIGFRRETAMLMLTVTALMGTLGKYLWGLWCDRYKPQHMAALCMALTGLGIFWGLLSGTLLTAILFIVCYGFGMGGVMSTHPVLTASLFGRKSFAAVYKYLCLFLFMETPGFIIMGLSFDYTQSYDTAFWGFMFTSLIAAGLVFSARKPNFN